MVVTNPQTGDSGMSRARITIGFDGEAARGEMEVADLAPLLVAWADVLKAANQAVNGDRASARVVITATAPGSFLVNLGLDVGVLDQILGVIDAAASHQDRVVAANNLLDVLIKSGSLAAGVSLGVLGIVKRLRGRRPERTSRHADGSVTIELDGKELKLSPAAARLIEDPAFREALARFGERLSNAEGIDQTFVADQDGTRSWSIRRSEARSLRLPPPEEREPETMTTRRQVWLELVSTHFRGDYKWRFTDGDTTFTATIEDQEFLRKVENGDVSFSAADKLLVELEEEQEIGNEIRKLATRVVKVIRHVPGPKQMRLL
ncbi:hypothetical protein LY05_00307 [Oceanicella actignis]|nr:hypothetical protein LY05_00307 [Oceanicella actignis]